MDGPWGEDWMLLATFAGAGVFSGSLELSEAAFGVLILDGSCGGDFFFTEAILAVEFFAAVFCGAVFCLGGGLVFFVRFHDGAILSW